MEALKLNSRSPERTQLLGGYLGQLAQKTDVFLLVGELGTGKTCLVQGIARGLGVKEYAFSPTFVLLREYRGRLPLYHIDFYRLDYTKEIADLGLEEYFYGDGVCAVEWAEKGLQLIPADHLLITLHYVPTSHTERLISLRPRGKRYHELIEQLIRRANYGSEYEMLNLAEIQKSKAKNQK
jgi:tRNA threonylcarbamoyladenosine biosynthesis protein TsaE